MGAGAGAGADTGVGSGAGAGAGADTGVGLGAGAARAGVVITGVLIVGTGESALNVFLPPTAPTATGAGTEVPGGSTWARELVRTSPKGLPCICNEADLSSASRRLGDCGDSCGGICPKGLGEEMGAPGAELVLSMEGARALWGVRMSAWGVWESPKWA
ncbi:hypothetical protein B484DRAFT_16760 [Ochromonadaceae sp. CCMP2298]|nr:hypothetical protein B484DRAFT_16760 [Ochromonadaceae sp. CCMP2298]